MGKQISVWSSAVVCLASGLIFFSAVPRLSSGIASQDQQIADLEKQIEGLNKKLIELRQSKAGTAAIQGGIPADWIQKLNWRCIGPAATGGRITAVAVSQTDPSSYWVATASGGLLKTVNNGITFEHQFDHEATVSIGDVCVAASDPNIVWVGTGENNPRNSVSYGDGVYKSIDGGKTWKNMGLKKSFQIGRIAIHPTNPNLVYVGALGRLYGPNPERGLFKTSNGGETWEKILFVDDQTGVIDVQMNPGDPETLLVATYERQRDLYDYNDPLKKFGPGSGLYKTTDGGKTFKKLTNGLPTCALGRIGIDYYRKDPNTVYVVVESEKLGSGPARAQSKDVDMGLTGEDAAQAPGAVVVWVFEKGAADRAGLHVGDVILSVGNKAIGGYANLLDELKNHKAGDRIQIRLNRAGKSLEVGLTLAGRQAPRPRPALPRQPGQQGPDPNLPFYAALGGQQENMQDRQGRDGFQSGGVYKSTDGGESWTRVNSLNPRPMYFSQIRVDPDDANRLYVLGIALFRSSNGGKSFFGDAGRGVHADHHALWIDPRDSRHMVVGGDGGFYVTYDRGTNWDYLNHLAIGQFYHVAVDSRRRYFVYGGLQDNGTWGGPSRTRGPIGPINEDWIMIGGGDGFRCQVDANEPSLIYWESQYGGFFRRDLRNGENISIRPIPPSPPPDPSRSQQFRFNWNSPFILSHHNSRVYYCAGNYVFRSLDRGNNPQEISPEITATSKGSASALAESPRNPNLLYVGTDDGNLWITRDGGNQWTNITKNVGLPGPRYVATIEPSHFEEGRAYVAFDGHRSDDDEPLLFVTEDFGKTWKSLRANLPWGSTRCLREDLQNPDLLFAGTEFAVWMSLNRGASWCKLNNNLPTVAVHELALHPTAGEIVAATHGRSLWILDVTPLRQMTPEVLKAPIHLFQPNIAVNWQSEPRHGSTNRRFVGQNPPPGAEIYYSLAKKVEKISLKVLDFEGKTVRDLSAGTEPGLHRITWDLALPPPPQAGPGEGASRRAPSGNEDRPGAKPQPRGRPTPFSPPPAGGGQERNRPRLAGPGMYRLVLTVDGKEFTQPLRVEADPGTSTNFITPKRR